MLVALCSSSFGGVALFHASLNADAVKVNVACSRLENVLYCSVLQQQQQQQQLWTV